MDRLFTENLAAVVLYLRKLLFASLTVGLQSIKRERKKNCALEKYEELSVVLEVGTAKSQRTSVF